MDSLRSHLFLSLQLQSPDVIKLIDNYSKVISCSEKNIKQLTAKPICRHNFSQYIRDIIPCSFRGLGFDHFFIFNSFRSIQLIDTNGNVIREFGPIYHYLEDLPPHDDLSCRELNHELYVLGFQNASSLIYVFSINGDLKRSCDVTQQNQCPIAFAFFPNGNIMVLYEHADNRDIATYEVFSQSGQKVDNMKQVQFSIFGSHRSEDRVGLEIYKEKIFVLTPSRLFILTIQGEVLHTFAKQPRYAYYFSQFAISPIGELFISYSGEKFIDVVSADDFQLKRVIRFQTEPQHFALLQSGHCIVLTDDQCVLLVK